MWALKLAQRRKCHRPKVLSIFFLCGHLGHPAANPKYYVVRKIVKQLVYSTFSVNNLVSFHLWWKKFVLKCQKIYKHFFHDCSLKSIILTVQLWKLAPVKSKKKIRMSLKIKNRAPSNPSLKSIPNKNPARAFRIKWEILFHQNSFVLISVVNI